MPCAVQSANPSAGTTGNGRPNPLTFVAWLEPGPCQEHAHLRPIEAKTGHPVYFFLQDLLFAVTFRGESFDLVLLDMVMPEMNGFDVLTAMNNNRQIEDIPVVMISAENGIEHIERAYDLGVTDYISRHPLSPHIGAEPHH